jgi:glycosyltransferase involved in cell wall biosynthesis
MLEPLGQSQVLAYLRLLARRHTITLISFEKNADLADLEAMAAQHREMQALGVRWIPLRYHHRPRLLATSWDLLTLTWIALKEALTGKIQIVHCRSYVPTFVALVLKAIAGKPFIFDMRSLWPDEMIAAGTLKPSGPMFLLLKGAERICLKEAASVVSMTHAAVEHLRRTSGTWIQATDFEVIPTCVDLDLFQPPVSRPPERDKSIAIGSIGSVLSGWFRLDWLMAFFRVARELDPEARFAIVSSEDPIRIRSVARTLGAPLDRLSVYRVRHREAPKAISTMDIVPMFYTTGPASICRSPTRMGEVLACGVPVIVNAGVGDVDEIVRRHNVGFILSDPSQEAMAEAFIRVRELLRDSHLADRCRKAAETCFSLDLGVRAYDGIYRRIV